VRLQARGFGHTGRREGRIKQRKPFAVHRYTFGSETIARNVSSFKMQLHRQFAVRHWAYHSAFGLSEQIRSVDVSDKWQSALIIMGNTNKSCRIISGHEITQFVEALYYKPEGSGFDSRWRHSDISSEVILPATLWHVDDSASKRIEYQEASWRQRAAGQCGGLISLPSVIRLSRHL
jgi:hypothetical protein